MTIQDIIDQADAAQKEGNFQKAYELYTKAIEVLPAADLYSERGVVLFHLNRLEDSLKDMDKAVEYQPDYGYRYSSRAYIKANMGMVKEAIEDYEKCIELEPDDSLAYNNMGLLMEKLGWQQQAEKNFNKADKLEGIPEKKKPSTPPTTNPPKQESTGQEPLNEIDPDVTKGRIIKDVFTKKESFKEFIQFIKSGFKLKE